MQRKILYLVNPISGVQKKEPLLQQIEAATRHRGIPYEIAETHPQGKYYFLEERIAQDGITDVVMLGGDGTVNQVIGALYRQPVRFGIIPLGSGNGLAYSARIPKSPKKALEIIFAGNARPADAFFVNGKFSCMLSGLGFDAHVAHDFANRASRGLLSYTQQSLINYFKAHPYQFEVILDGFSFFTDAFFICIANSNQFGNNVRIAPEASISDGLLDIVIVQKMNKAKLPFAVLRQIRGNNKLQKLVDEISQNNILYFQTPSLTIRNLKLAPLHIDGDPATTQEELHISILPECFQLLQPA